MFKQDFLKWWVIALICSIVYLVGFVAGIIMYMYKKNKEMEVQETSLYLTPDEFDDYVVQQTKRHLYAPVNLKMFEGARKIRKQITVGGGTSQATEVYVRKFSDANVVNTDVYYVFARVNQPDTFSLISRDHEPPAEEEKALIIENANNLALSPAKYREAKIVTRNLHSGFETTEVTKEPVETFVVGNEKEKDKEEVTEE